MGGRGEKRGDVLNGGEGGFREISRNAMIGRLIVERFSIIGEELFYVLCFVEFSVGLGFYIFIVFLMLVVLFEEE